MNKDGGVRASSAGDRAYPKPQPRPTVINTTAVAEDVPAALPRASVDPLVTGAPADTTTNKERRKSRCLSADEETTLAAAAAADVARPKQHQKDQQQPQPLMYTTADIKAAALEAARTLQQPRYVAIAEQERRAQAAADAEARRRLYGGVEQEVELSDGDHDDDSNGHSNGSKREKTSPKKKTKRNSVDCGEAETGDVADDKKKARTAAAAASKRKTEGEVAEDKKPSADGTTTTPTTTTTSARIKAAALAALNKRRTARARQLRESSAALKTMLNTNGISTAVVPIVPLDRCAPCDYCVMLTDAASVETNLARVVRTLSTAGMKVIYEAPVERPAGVDVDVPNTNSEEVNINTTPPAAPATQKRLRSMYCFSVEVCPVSGVAEVVSLHVTLLPGMADIFYSHYAAHYNKAALSGGGDHNGHGIDDAFPGTTADMTDAQKKRIVHRVLTQLLGEKAGVAVDNTGVALFPAHVDAVRDAIWSECVGGKSGPVVKAWKLLRGADEAAIAAYFGEETMFYFAWMNHYQRWLLAASCLSVTTLVMSVSRETDPSSSTSTSSSSSSSSMFATSIDGTAALPSFIVLLIIGSVLCVKTWERRCSTLSMRYKLFKHEGQLGHDEPRREFRGRSGDNPITGQPGELQFPGWVRALILQPISWCIIALYAVTTIAIMVAFVNLEGYTSVDEKTGARGFAVIPVLRRLSLPGCILNKASFPFLAIIPTVLYSFTVSVLSANFKLLATRLTGFENYKYRGEYLRALTQKRIVFEFINSYAKLFFLALVRQRITDLATSLKVIFFTAVFTRLATGTAMPFLATHGSRVAAAIRRWSPDPTDGTVVGGVGGGGGVAGGGHGGSSDSALDQADELLESYEVYSDYVEMAIQFGYIVLFAVAFPLAPVVALLSNVIEIRSDLFKLCYVVRRPVPRLGLAENGTWAGVFQVMVLAAVVTNTVLFAVGATPMIATFFPALFTFPHEAVILDFATATDPDADPVMVLVRSATPVLIDGMGRYAVLAACAAEHLVMGAAMFLFWRISSTPRSVRVHVQRRRHERVAALAAAAAATAAPAKKR